MMCNQVEQGIVHEMEIESLCVCVYMCMYSFMGICRVWNYSVVKLVVRFGVS